MKVLILNTSEKTGGAAIASRRLFEALRRSGVDARMLVRDKSSADPHVIGVGEGRFARLRNRLLFLMERLQIFLHNSFDREKLFAVSTASYGIPVADHPAVREADIIHLHWVNQGFLSLKEIGALLRTGKPVIWTMHDMWPVTGVCHHARECTRYEQVCEACPQLNGSGPDLSTRVFEKKLARYQQGIRFVGCSQWLAGTARKSLLTAAGKVDSIPNPIDIGKYAPSDKSEARKALGLPSDKKLLLFGALNLTDKRKGIDYLIEALSSIAPKRRDVELVVFGQIKQELSDRLPFRIHAMGYLNDDDRIIRLYNAVDAFVTPSLEENLPNTIMEAMACGTPCIGFRIGGIPEMIDHRENGYVAEYRSAEDLAAGIGFVLEGAAATLGRKAREKAERNYAEAVVAGQYIELYQQALKR